MATPDPLLRSAAALLEQPARRAELLNAFPSLVWCSDAGGDCNFVNQAWEDYTGRHTDAELGNRWMDSIHPEDRTRVKREWDEALGLRRPLETQYRLLRVDGTYGWLHHAAVPIADEHGKLTGYLGSCTDITEQRSAQLRAVYQEQEIRMLADNVPVLIAYFDREELRCRFANRPTHRRGAGTTSRSSDAGSRRSSARPAIARSRRTSSACCRGSP